MKILIIDDSPSEQELIRSYLQHLDYQITAAKNAEIGLERYHQEKPELVLIGVFMDGSNGPQVARLLRQQTYGWVPIILLSSKTDPKDILLGIEAGADDYLAKPIQKQTLIAKLMAMKRIALMRKQLLKTSKHLEQANCQLAHLATLDGLTGIANRRHLDTVLSKEIARARRHQQPLTLIIADIDQFKKYNDHYGHIAGDDSLKSVANALQDKLLRPGELVARYGGEEFCMLLPNCNSADAQVMAEKIHNAVRGLEIPHAGMSPYAVLTLSMGVVTVIPDRECSAKTLLQQADKKLYLAKDLGRDQWQI